MPAKHVKLIVATQADGHYMPGSAGIRFRFSRPRKISRMRELLTGSGLNWDETKYPSEPKVTVFRIRDLPIWLESRKIWTSELLSWDVEALDILMKELVHWDGSKCGPNSVSYTSTVKENADWMSTVAHLTGRAATISKRESRGNWKTAYRVTIRNAWRTEVHPDDWKVLGEATEVFCPTAKYGACLFRHNGTIFITHQTGRWAGTAQINFQNFRKKPILCNEFGLMEVDEKRIDGALRCKKKTGEFPVWVRHAIDIRHLIVPRPGMKMVTSDLSQIEPRVLNWLAGNHDLLDMVRTGMPIYEAHARTTMNWQGGNLKEENADIYQLSKARVLALGYGAGSDKFISMAQVYGVDVCADDPEFIDEAQLDGSVKKVSGYGTTSKAIVKAFRDANPKITGFWKRLDEFLRRSVGEDLVLTLPSGRRMTYEKIRCEARIEKDKKTNEPKRRTVYTAQIGAKRVMTYGGKLCENVTQAASRDVMGEAIVRMDKNGWWNLWSCHDECILEVDQSVTEADITREMTRVPEWLKGCPLDSETKTVPHYCK